MGLALGGLFHQLWNEVVWLHLKWRQFRQLYGTDEGTIDILNRTAPVFFRTIQNVLWEDTLIHLCRLTDPPRSSGKLNLSITQVLSHVNDTVVKQEVANLVRIAEDKVKFARDWRNRRIAHRDMALALNQAPAALAVASRTHVEDALLSLRNVMNRINSYYMKSEVAYEHGIFPGDADALVHHLRAVVSSEDTD